MQVQEEVGQHHHHRGYGDLVGAGCRKMLFQICDSPRRMSYRFEGHLVSVLNRWEVCERAYAAQQGTSSDRHERSRVFPLPHFFLELSTLVDFQLPVVGKSGSRIAPAAGARDLQS